MCAGLVLVIAAGVLMGLVSGVLLLFAALIVIRRFSHHTVPPLFFLAHFMSFGCDTDADTFS